MVARLGDVLYWTGCVVAVVGLLLTVMVLAVPGSDADVWLSRYVLAALLGWPLGRAARYILAAK